MITREEIDQKALDFGIHQANVQRDYVFGWLLLGVYTASTLKDILILKGGNGFRKAYFPNTRFSHDLDFSTLAAVDQELVRTEFGKICQFVQEHTGVVFNIDRNRVEVQNEIDNRRRVFDVRLYFQDFYGNADHISIRLSIDITEFDRIYLPVQERRLIHPYSDAGTCSGQVRILKLEEMLAAKLKCLLQRRHTADVYDLVYAIFINREIDVDRQEVVSTFFRKTIYDRSPGVARQLLLDLPLSALKTAWSRYIIAPIQGVLEFDVAVAQFREIITSMFAAYPSGGYAALSYFPSALRTPLMQAGTEQRVVALTYDGVRRLVEPYSLVFKRRKDGHGEEYLYGYDQTGGRTSGPGIKTFLNQKISRIEILDQRFEPRYPVELAKAGEHRGSGYFARPFGSGHGGTRRPWGSFRHGWRYTIECSYCNRRFKRMRRNTALKPHRDSVGNACFGRRGLIVDQTLV